MLETIFMKKKARAKKSVAVIGLKGLPAFGGAATVGQNIITQLHHSFKFTVLSVDTHASSSYQMGDVEQLIFKSFPIKKLNVLFYYIKSCWYVLFKANYDLIHLHHTDGAFILPFLRLKYKVLLTSHQRPQENSKWPWWVKLFFSFNELLAIRFSTVFTVVSRPLQQLYSSRYKKEIVYIPNGVDMALLPILDKIEANTDDAIMFAAGRIIPVKGLHILLKALKHINYKGRLKIAGNMDQLPAYKKNIEKLAKGLHVEYVGMIKERVELLSLVKSAKLFIFPSLTEAMSIMLFEAAMVKVPIICSDIAANTAVFNKDEVIFFKTEDELDLAFKIKEFLQPNTNGHEKKGKAFEKLTKNYTWDIIAPKYALIYKSLIP